MKRSYRKQLLALVMSAATGLTVIGLSLIRPQPVQAIPALARKYGLPCSACHEAWPKLNNFGITFRDNGYQLGNERDSPIYQNNSYFPMTLRMTPNWHLEKTNRVAVDSVPGDPTSALVEQGTTSHGFDLSGLDILTIGTLYKNISFALVPSADETGAFHFESVWVRWDNIGGSRWANLKFGKHELDMPEALSEKRSLTLSGASGGYNLYHFDPLTGTNEFGLGDNQLGIELTGHSHNSYTRYAFDVLSSNSGNVDFVDNNGAPSSNSYDIYAHFSQAFQVPKLGVQRVGVLAYSGRRATYALTSGGAPIPGTGQGDAPFYRVGAYASLYFGRLDWTGFFYHGQDDKYLATATPKLLGPGALPAGAQDAAWNGGINEVHFTVNPQFIVFGRYEVIRMSQQPFPDGVVTPAGFTSTSTLGDTDGWAIGYRWYPIMFSRAGLAWHNEYSRAKIKGASPLSGQDLTSSSVFVGLDFDF
jgi:hypothetical protein